MRLIDADELIKEAEKEGAYGYVSAKQIADFPTADVVKHGRWVKNTVVTICVPYAGRGTEPQTIMETS